MLDPKPNIQNTKFQTSGLIDSFAITKSVVNDVHNQKVPGTKTKFIPFNFNDHFKKQ